MEYLEDIISGEDEDCDEYDFDEDMIDEMEALSDSLSDLSSMIDYEVFKLSL